MKILIDVKEINDSNPSISIQLNSYVDRVLRLEKFLNILRKRISYRLSNRIENYVDLLKIFEEKLKIYNELIMSYKSLYDLRDIILNKQKQR